jgi:hypothetical protein
MFFGSSWHQTSSAFGKRAAPHQRLHRERIELFEAQEIDVVDAALLALIEQVVIDLARAEHDAADLRSSPLSLIVVLPPVELGVVPEHAVEGRAFGHVGERATPPSCGAAATSASSRSAACGSRGASGGAGCGSSWPASCSWRPACCLPRIAAGSAPDGPRSAPAPAPRSRAAAASRGRTCAATCARPTR